MASTWLSPPLRVAAHVRLLADGSLFFADSRVSLGSICSLSESVVSRMPTTRRSLIISSFIPT